MPQKPCTTVLFHWQGSWLGYFATTGLDYLDAVLLDKWHAPQGTDTQFAEPILRLPDRLCYTPVPWMPAVAPAPIVKNGYAIYSSHTIEHLYPNEIPQAMREFLRVLKTEGYAVITCPDLQAAAELIAQDKLMDVAYNSPAGPVTPFDIVYSHRIFTGRDKPYMAHHCGFTLSVLSGTLRSNGFASVAGKRRPQSFDLWVVATKGPMEDGALRELAGKVLPV